MGRFRYTELINYKGSCMSKTILQLALKISASVQNDMLIEYPVITIQNNPVYCILYSSPAKDNVGRESKAKIMIYSLHSAHWEIRKAEETVSYIDTHAAVLYLEMDPISNPWPKKVQDV